MLPAAAVWSWDLRPLLLGLPAVPVAPSGFGGVEPQGDICLAAVRALLDAGCSVTHFSDLGSNALMNSCQNSVADDRMLGMLLDRARDQGVVVDVNRTMRALTLKPDSEHTRQLGATAHERSSVARSVTDRSHARFTCANCWFAKPLSDALCGS